MTTKTDTKTINWTGKSGRQYLYYIYPIGSTFKAVPGNYIFAKETSPGRYRPIYIGETEDLSERFDNHHKMACIRREGATHIHAHQNDAGVTARRQEERDLVAKWNPSCNG